LFGLNKKASVRDPGICAFEHALKT